jgi:hypothetical protein
MTRPPDDLPSVAILRARAALRRTLEPQLRGHGLDIRELTTALAIGNPAAPDHGRVHITYTTADVSLRRVTWTYLGPLEGCEPSDDPDREPGVTAEKIIAILIGHTPPAGDPALGPRPGSDDPCRPSSGSTTIG